MEAKLLYHAYNKLKVAPAQKKPEIQAKIRDAASGGVLLKTSDPLAWKIEIEWADVENFKDYDSNLLKAYTERFPDEGLAKVLTGFLYSEISPFDSMQNTGTTQQKENELTSNKTTKKNSKDKAPLPVEPSIDSNSDPVSPPSENEEPIEDDDLEETDASVAYSADLVLQLMTDGFASEPNSLLAARILGAYYIWLGEYETACDIGLNGLKLVKSLKNSVGSLYPNAVTDLECILGTSYVYYQAPKNFPLALELFEKVLKSNPRFIAAKIGKGLIYREQAKYTEAKKLLKSALDEQSDNATILFEYSWCQILQGDFEEGRNGLLLAMKGIPGNDLLSRDYRARIWWRIGQSYWIDHNPGEEFDQETISALFSAFTSSLKESPSHAPTFTSLGKLYSTVLNDVVRATKCFYKAFEIDGGEIEAAEHLATEFADSQQWDLVEVVATRVIESERVRLSSGKEPSWPYRALGIATLNARDYPKAVKCFQSAIRLSPEDSNSWVGLGESYINSGRYVAAAKTFTRAQVLDPQNWIATYHLGTVQRLTQEYNLAIKTFEHVASLRPDENCVKFALIETMLMSAKYELKKEVFGKAALLAQTCIETAVKAINVGLELTQDLWKVLSECCEVYLNVQSKIIDLPMKLLFELVQENSQILLENEDMNLISAIDGVTASSLEKANDLIQKEKDDELEGVSKANFVNTIGNLYILFLKFSFIFARKDKNTRAIAWYNLGLGQLRIFMDQANKENISLLNASIDCFRRVIRLQNSNADVWNAYGVACSYLNLKVSQHCFIRSVSLDAKQPSAWNNLAVLYIQKGDLQLSEAAIGRSLIIDPDFVPAWIGQGIISQTLGNAKDAHKSFEHSYKISNGVNKLSKLYYALTVFEQLKSGTNETLVSQKLESAVLSLQKYLRLSPESHLGITLQGLLLERSADYEYAMEHTNKLCNLYELEYEESESQDALIKFVKAKAHLARVSLGAKQYDSAIEHGEFASDVSNDAVIQGGEVAEELKISRLSAFLTCGLSYYFLKEYGNSIECFKHALVESDEDQDVIVLLAQVLWAQGGEDEKEVALEQLFGSIGKHGASTKVALTLGAIGIVHDHDLIEAAEDELKSIPEARLESEDPLNYVPQMLSAMNHAKGTDIKQPWYQAAFYKPWDYGVWRHVEPKIALELAKTGNGVSTTDLSNAYIGAGEGLSSSLKGIFYAPWNDAAWASLVESMA